MTVENGQVTREKYLDLQAGGACVGEDCKAAIRKSIKTKRSTQ